MSPTEKDVLAKRVGSKRNVIACQACRAAKTKCDLTPYNPPCHRCSMASIPCVLSGSRRGRRKGSKNRRTFEKLLNMRDAASVVPQPECSDPSPRKWQRSMSKSAIRSADTSPELELFSEHESLGSQGMITPSDRHNLMKGFDEKGIGNSRLLTRKLMHSLGGQFPIVEEAGSVNSGKNQVGFQDPLPSIIRLARRGWNLGDGDPERVRRVRALPITHLPAEDIKLMEKWTPQALQDAIGETTRYFEHGLAGSKRDVAPDLDPLQRGVISEARGNELLDAFWKLVHPQWAMLDPAIHTLDFMRTRSALLTTSVLAIGSLAIATLDQRTDEQVSEAIRLHAHAEKLNLVVYSTGARSIEIVQAFILLSRFGLSSRTRLDEQRWIRSAMIPRLSAEIGMPFPDLTEVGMLANNEIEWNARWNGLRTRAFMILNEYRFYAFSGRVPMNLDQFVLSKTQVEEISCIEANSPSSSLPALYELYLFQREVDQRLGCEDQSPQAGFRLEADINWVAGYIQSWITRWCSDSNPSRKTWHLHHDALSCKLLLYSRFARKLPQSADRARHQRRMLDTSLQIFRIALETSHSIHMTHRASIFPFAATIILRFSDCRDLVLRLALRMAGEPGRPYVPTFVRNAGNQLLAMLCANESKPKHQLRVWPNADRESPETSDCRCNRENYQVGMTLPAATALGFHSSASRPENWEVSTQWRNETIISSGEDLNQQKQRKVGIPLTSTTAATSAESFSATLSATEPVVDMNAEQDISVPSDGAFFGLDFGFQFPYIPSNMEPQAPFLNCQGNSPDIDDLLGLSSLISSEDVTQSSVPGQDLPGHLEFDWQLLFSDMGSSNAWMGSV